MKGLSDICCTFAVSNETKTMADKTFIKLFDEKQVRYVWDEEEQKYYFSIVDVVQVLTEQPDFQKARKYWNKLKQRLIEEGFEPVTNCHQLKMVSPNTQIIKI